MALLCVSAAANCYFRVLTLFRFQNEVTSTMMCTQNVCAPLYIYLHLMITCMSTCCVLSNTKTHTHTHTLNFLHCHIFGQKMCHDLCTDSCIKNYLACFYIMFIKKYSAIPACCKILYSTVIFGRGRCYMKLNTTVVALPDDYSHTLFKTRTAWACAW
jgi:hypothetical protein